MSNKSEILYDLIFKSIIRILTQNNLYNERYQTITIESIIRILTQNNLYNERYQTITIDKEIALINAVKINFENITKIGCWFHLKQNLLNQAKICGGLFNKNNTKISYI